MRRNFTSSATTHNITAHWKSNSPSTTLNTIRVRIHALRKKINAEGEKLLIRAVKDMGYVLE